jgi:hypothetical protein
VTVAVQGDGRGESRYPRTDDDHTHGQRPV